MKEINRYDVVVNRITGSPGTSHNDNGKFCFYDDHAAIVAALNEKVQALAAENAVLISREETASMTKVDKSDFPATEAAIRELRAQGIHFAVNRILAAWETGFIDDTARQAYDISGAVLCAIEFLPNASDGEFSRDYADEVRTRIRNGEIDL